MPDKASHIITTLSFLLLLTTAYGQHNENKEPGNSGINIKTETGYYLHTPIDSHWPDSLCLMWIKEYDTNGQLVKYTDHWKCGQLYCVYEYQYDTAGMCRKSWISYYTNNFKRTAMIHKFDGHGKLIERWPSENIPTYPVKFTYEYNEQGVRTKRQEWREKDGELYVDYSDDRKIDSVFDMRPEYKVYDSNNDLRWTVKREFEYFENKSQLTTKPKAN